MGSVCDTSLLVHGKVPAPPMSQAGLAVGLSHTAVEKQFGKELGTGLRSCTAQSQIWFVFRINDIIVNTG